MKPAARSAKKSKSTSGIRLSDEQLEGLAEISMRTGIKVGTLKQIAMSWFIAYARKNKAVIIDLEGPPLDPAQRDGWHEADGAQSAKKDAAH